MSEDENITTLKKTQGLYEGPDGEKRVVEARLRPLWMDPRCRDCGGRRQTVSENKRTKETVVTPCERCAETNGMDPKPTAKNEREHPRAVFQRDDDGKIVSKDGAPVVTAGGEVFNTGMLGGPAIHLSFTEWTTIPNDRGGRTVLEHILSDPVVLAQVQIRTRPFHENIVNLLDHPSIEHVGAEKTDAKRTAKRAA